MKRFFGMISRIVLGTFGLVLSFFVGLTLLGFAAISAVVIAIALAFRGRRKPKNAGYSYHDFGGEMRNKTKKKPGDRFDTVIEVQAVRVK